MPTPETPSVPIVIIPDPNLTLSEALNIHASVLYWIEHHTESGDAVLVEGLNKLMEACTVAARAFPEALEAVKREYEMHKRLAHDHRPG